MQWLIDIAIAAMKAWYADYGGFHDRGDPAADDLTLVNFIRDTAWHDLDLSAIVPENAKGVSIKCLARVAEIGTYFGFRKAGNVNDKNISIKYSSVSNIYFGGDLTCALDADRKIQYKFVAATWTFIHFTVKGWWF